MAKKMKRGERYPVILTQLDLIILNNLKEKSFSVLKLTDKVNIAPISLRKRLRRLRELELINKNKITGSNKIIVTISTKGKIILKQFDKLL